MLYIGTWYKYYAYKKHKHKILICTLLHAVFVTVEFVYGIKVNSVSLLADAMHNAADVAGVLIAWFSYWIADKVAPQRFTFGFKKATVIAVFINAVLLMLSVGGIAWEAIMRLLSPKPVISVTMIVVASVGVVINGLSAYLFLDKQNADMNIKGVFIHLCADAVVSAGVIVAGVLIFFKGWLWADPVMSLIAALFIFFSSWRLFVSSINFMMVAVPDSIDLATVKSDIARIIKVLTRWKNHVILSNY